MAGLPWPAIAAGRQRGFFRRKGPTCQDLCQSCHADGERRWDLAAACPPAARASGRQVAGFAPSATGRSRALALERSSSSTICLPGSGGFSAGARRRLRFPQSMTSRLPWMGVCARGADPDTPDDCVDWVLRGIPAGARGAAVRGAQSMWALARAGRSARPGARPARSTPRSGHPSAEAPQRPSRPAS